MEKNFRKLVETLHDSIFTWNYFVDFDKVKKNISKIEKELNLLNFLIGKDNIEDEFINLITEYPNVKKVLPILIAVRNNKLKEIPIVSNVDILLSEKKDYIFIDGLKREELIKFFIESGLRDIFKNKNIKNFVDYVFGIEVGMDTNGRKNRTGDLMEGIVSKFLDNFCLKNTNFIYIDQATKDKIKEKFNYEIKIDKNNRKFDFALFNKKEEKLFLIEVNFYSGSGTKLKATAGEYQKLNDFIKNQGICFIWVTDGKGWLTATNSLEEAFNHNDFIINLKMLREGILEKITSR